MAKHNYFDDEGNIEQHRAIEKWLDAVKARTEKKPLPQDADETSFFRDAAQEEAPSASPLPEVHTEKNPLYSRRPLTTEELDKTVEKFEKKAQSKVEQQDAEVNDAIKAFSHKSGDTFKTVAHQVAKSAETVAKSAEKQVVKRAKTVAKKVQAEERQGVSRLKRVIVTFLLFLFLVLVFAGFIGLFMVNLNKENSKVSRFNTDAAKVCNNYVQQYGVASYENLYNTYGVEGYRLTGLCFLRELDFDNDDSSELMLTIIKNGEYYNEVWGYNDKDEFAVLYSQKAAQTGDKADDTYSLLYRRNNKYYIAQFDDEDLNKINLMQLKDGKFEKKYDCTYDAETQSYAVGGKDDTTAVEKIRYSVFRAEKAIVQAEAAAAAVEAFTGKSASTETLNAKMNLETSYFNVILDYNQRYGMAAYNEKESDAYITGLAAVELVDFDKDGQDELVLVYRKPIKVRNESANDYSSIEVDTYCCDIYRYNGSRAVMAYSGEGISTSINDSSDSFIIIEHTKEKNLYCVNRFESKDYGRFLYASSNVLEFDGEGFVTTLDASYKREYGYTEYYLDGKYASRSEFSRRGYEVAMFDGDESYDKDAFTVVYVQRDKTNQKDVEKQLTKTVETIQKLDATYTGEEKK